LSIIAKNYIGVKYFLAKNKTGKKQVLKGR